MAFNGTEATTNEDLSIGFRPLSVPQQKLVAILPIPSAILSVCASLAIILSIKRSRLSDEWTPYHGLLAAMTLCNILWSVTLAMGNFLYDQDNSFHIFAYGSEHTCTLVGFLNEFAFCSSIPYMACFSVYFLLTTKYELPNSLIASRYETKMHIVCLGYALAASFTGLFYNAYDERSETIGCWVRQCEYDIDGSPINCLPIVVDIFLGRFLTTTVLIFVIVVYTMIRRHVRRALQRHEDKRSSIASLNARRQRAVTRSLSSLESTEDMGRNENDDSEAQELSNRREERETRKEEAKRRRLKLLKMQSFYFVTTFFFVNMPTGMLRLIFASGFGDDVPPFSEYMSIPYDHFWVMVAQAILFPLQSCANMLIYLSPKYMSIRRHYERQSRWWAIRRTIWGALVQPTIEDDVNRNRPIG